MKVTVERLFKTFASMGKPVVDDVSFEVLDGELVTLLGPSGCGKTTVLRLIAGLEKPTSGRIAIGDAILNDEREFVSPHERGIGMVFQSYALWPHRSVRQNIAFPLEIQKITGRELNERIAAALSLVALEGLAERYPSELSGGQQQRVALARALAQRPRILLLDEPLSNLDAKLREQMRRELKMLQSQLKLTMIYVTHDRLEALELSHRMAILDQGSLVQIDTPENIVKNPANDFVRHFIG